MLHAVAVSAEALSVGRQNRNCEGALPFLAGDASLHRRYSVATLLRRRARGVCLDTFDLTVSSICTSSLSSLRLTQRTAFPKSLTTAMAAAVTPRGLRPATASRSREGYYHRRRDIANSSRAFVR
jgi:hypothetical protein